MSKQSWRVLKDLSDPAAERTIIAGIIQHGSQAYYEIDSLISNESFSVKENALIYSALRKLITEERVEKPDIGAILTTVRTFDRELVEKNNLSEYIGAICSEKILKDNMKAVAGVVSKLSLTRSLKKGLENAAYKLSQVTGEESITDIVNIAESSVSEFSDSLVHEDEIINIGAKISEFINHFADQKGKTLGIPSGFPQYDESIGGGLTAPGIHMFGSRTKGGKSFIATNIAKNVSFLGIPVLYLDTELDEKYTTARFIASVSGIEINNIRAGKFDSMEDSRRIGHAEKQIAKAPYYYYNISGKHHKHWVSIVRKWIMKEVGFDEEGNVKPCLVILDYVKTMDLEHTGDFQEHQYLGQVMTDLHNFSIKYNIPIVGLVQLNRDGIDGETSGVVSGSDRIGFLCSSLTIFKPKSEQDLAADPAENGDKKFVVILSRYGGGTASGEYINVKCNFAIGRMEEGPNNIEARKGRQNLIANAVKAKEGTRQKKEYAKADETKEEGIPL